MSDLYLVTGGCGFIGSHIVDALLARGDSVRVLDAKLPFVEIDGAGKANRIHGDIRNPAIIPIAMKDVDYVIHQAAIPGVQQSLDNTFRTNSVNVEGTLRLLDAAKYHGVKKFVYASSSSIYGNATMNPKSESMRPSPASPYAVSKYAGELYCNTYMEVYRLPIVILRYFNVFGPRQPVNGKHGAVVPRFLDAAMKGEVATIEGNGDQTRDFTFVQNVVDANLLACDSDKATGHTFNIGCGKSTPINTLCSFVDKVTGKQLRIKFGNPRVGDVKHSMASIKKARKILGYEPKIGLLEGLKLTWEWMKVQ
jgi:UDP-glucose 4-epimerase